MSTSCDAFLDACMGIFNPLSFLKILYANVTPSSLDLSLRLSSLDNDEAHKEHFKVLSGLNELDAKDYIFELTADRHETHHYHQFLLLPACSINYNLLYTLFIINIGILERAVDNYDNSMEPFQPSTGFVIPDNLRNIIEYYSANYLLPGAPQAVIGKSGIFYSYKINNHGFKGELPVAKLGGTYHPLGLTPLIESWTWSAVRSMSRYNLTDSQYQWYLSTKSGEVNNYTIIDSILLTIFGEAYAKATPLLQHRLIAKLVVSACTIDPRMNDEFFQIKQNQPGWNLIDLLNYLHDAKEGVIKDGLLDIDACVRSISRHELAINKFSLTDYYKYLLDAKSIDDGSVATTGITDFIKKHYSNQCLNTLKIYLEDNDSFLNTIQYLSTTRMELIGRIPMMIVKKPGKNMRELVFPLEKNLREWFTWFMLTQLMFSFMVKKPNCPIVKFDLDLDCDRDNGCTGLSRLKHKDVSKCYMLQITRMVKRSSDSI